MRPPDDYDELAITIVAKQPKGSADDHQLSAAYEARVLWSPYDGGKETYVPPYEREQMAKLLDALRTEVRGSTERAALPPEPSPPGPSAREVGETLFETLFSGEIEKIFLRSWSTIRGLPRRGLRLRLVLDPQDPDVRHLAALPWELLRSRDTNDDFSLLARTPIPASRRHWCWVA